MLPIPQSLREERPPLSSISRDRREKYRGQTDLYRLIKLDLILNSQWLILSKGDIN